jgi:hypothetical protein
MKMHVLKRQGSGTVMLDFIQHPGLRRNSKGFDLQGFRRQDNKELLSFLDRPFLLF